MEKPTVLIVCLLLGFFAISERACAPTCENLTLDRINLRTKCNITIAALPMKCQFTLQNGGIDKLNVTVRSEHITHTYSYVNNILFYTTSCTLVYSVDGLEPGNWTVKVIMYLEGSFDQGLHGQASNTLLLSAPTVNIDPDKCPKGLDGEVDTNVRDGYIRQGERASCLCTRVHAGNPPGQVTWSSEQGGTFDILAQSGDASTIQINSPGTYICWGKTVLDDFMTYKPKYAYGPTEGTLIFADENFTEVPNKPLNLCRSKDLLVTMNCVVKGSDVQPGLDKDDFTLNIPNGFITKQMHSTTSGGMYTLVTSLAVNSGGSHKIVCEARNPKFTDIKMTQTMTVEVREPPSDPPKISAQSSQHGNILVEGDDVTLTCNVSGGYPSVQSVTLTCGQDQSVTSNGALAELALMEIGLSYNETKCTCNATHVTGCYDLMGILSLTVIIANGTQSEMKDSLPIAAAVGGAVGAFVVIAAIVVGVIFCIRRGRKQRAAESSQPRGYDNLEHDPTEVHVDNSELYLSFKGYHRQQDPTAVSVDNSELNGAVNQGYNPQQDPTAVSTDNSELYATVSRGYNPQRDPTAVFRDNSELYGAVNHGYDPKQDQTAVFRDNSELYATVSRGPTSYINVKDDDHQPSMMSAAALPKRCNPEPLTYVNVKDDDHQPTIVSAAGLSEQYSPDSKLNSYDEIDPEELKKKQKLLATKPKAKPATRPKLKLPTTPKPNILTTVAPGGPPHQSGDDYEGAEHKDQGNRSTYSLALNPDLLKEVTTESLGEPLQHSARN